MKVNLSKYAIVLSICYTFTSDCLSLTFDDFARAVAKVESGGNPKAIGDNGKARGILQIHEVCFIDAKSFDKELNRFKYSDVFDPRVSKRVLWAYCARYEPEALKNGNFQVLARLWNGGPSWDKKMFKTDGYWLKVSKALYD